MAVPLRQLVHALAAVKANKFRVPFSQPAVTGIQSVTVLASFPHAHGMKTLSAASLEVGAGCKSAFVQCVVMYLAARRCLVGSRSRTRLWWPSGSRVRSAAPALKPGRHEEGSCIFE